MRHNPQTVESVLKKLRGMRGHVSAKDKVVLSEATDAILELGNRVVEAEKRTADVDRIRRIMAGHGDPRFTEVRGGEGV